MEKFFKCHGEGNRLFAGRRIYFSVLLKERLYLNVEAECPRRHTASVQKESGVMAIMEALGQKSGYQRTIYSSNVRGKASPNSPEPYSLRQANCEKALR